MRAFLTVVSTPQYVGFVIDLKVFISRILLKYNNFDRDLLFVGIFISSKQFEECILMQRIALEPFLPNSILQIFFLNVYFQTKSVNFEHI